MRFRSTGYRRPEGCKSTYLPQLTAIPIIPIVPAFIHGFPPAIEYPQPAAGILLQVANEEVVIPAVVASES